jgi:hypothetical protein
MARDRTRGDVLGAFLLSRAVVWAAGVVAIAVSGLHETNPGAFDPADATRPFGGVGDALVGPGAYWDSVWFMRIAEQGYSGEDAAFFPLYPLLVAAAAVPLGSPVVAGIVVSAACFGGALWLLHRLVALDFGAEAARLCVLLVACFPAAVFFSAVYSEALFLLLSVGAVYAARTGRFDAAGAAGALASGTRSAGLLLLVPLAMLWWGARRTRAARRRDLAWVALVPLGLVLFCLYLAAEGVGATAPFEAQQSWSRELALPLAGVVQGAEAAWEGARQILAGEPRTWPVYDPAWLNVALFACLLCALIAVAGALRRLPRAYALYALAALALPLTVPAQGDPLMSLPRFLAVLWPLHLWLALWLGGRGRTATAVVLAGFLAGLALVSAEVSTWGWVA